MTRTLSCCPLRRTVFISCPGDLTDAKEAAAEAVDEVGRLFAPHGVQVSSWCHETCGRPGVGTDAQAVVTGQVPVDYDIYVGLMWSRLGTPTPRAPSGTVEEFLQAHQRFEATGKPDILFYFCTSPADPKTESGKQQLESVGDFRRAYPGLFAAFQSVEELKALVKHHLIDLLLREPGRRMVRRRGWALWVARQLDDIATPPAYLDRSSRFVVRSLGNLATLLDLPSLLNDEEQETLLATQYLRALRVAGAHLSVVRKKIIEAFPSAFDWDAAVLAADLARDDTGAITEHHQYNRTRCGFLAALLRLADALDLDHAAITRTDGSLIPPLPHDPIQNWLAYLTRRVHVSRGGVVGFHLGIPAGQESLAQDLCRNVGMIFEACWHRLRAVLSVQGVAVARIPTAWAPSEELVAVPDSVLSRLDLAADEAKNAIRALQHFGEAPLCPLALETVLPLPCSAIRQPVGFTFHPDLRHTLRLWRDTGTEARELSMRRPEELLLDPSLLWPPGARYRWSLQRDDGDFLSEAATGVVWQLTPADQTRLAAGQPLHHPRQALLLRLGLHNDLLQELWPRLVSGDASLSECECVYDALLTNYDWLQANAPESSQVDQIRNVGAWVHRQILSEKGDDL